MMKRILEIVLIVVFAFMLSINVFASKAPHMHTLNPAGISYNYVQNSNPLRHTVEVNERYVCSCGWQSMKLVNSYLESHNFVPNGRTGNNYHNVTLGRHYFEYYSVCNKCHYIGQNIWLDFPCDGSSDGNCPIILKKNDTEF